MAERAHSSSDVPNFDTYPATPPAPPVMRTDRELPQARWFIWFARSGRVLSTCPIIQRSTVLTIWLRRLVRGPNTYAMSQQSALGNWSRPPARRHQKLPSVHARSEGSSFSRLNQTTRKRDA